MEDYQKKEEERFSNSEEYDENVLVEDFDEETEALILESLSFAEGKIRSYLERGGLTPEEIEIALDLIHLDMDDDYKVLRDAVAKQKDGLAREIEIVCYPDLSALDELISLFRNGAEDEVLDVYGVNGYLAIFVNWYLESMTIRYVGTQGNGDCAK